MDILETRELLTSNLQIQFQETGYTALTVSDNGPGDTDPLDGSIVYSGTYGHFHIPFYGIAASSTQTTPGLYDGLAQLDLVPSRVTNLDAGSAHTLSVTITDTNFNFPTPPPLTLAITASSTLKTGNGPSTLTYQGFADPANQPFTTNPATVFATSPVVMDYPASSLATSRSGSASRDGFIPGPGGIYSLTGHLTLNLAPLAQVTIAAGKTEVPPPTFQSVTLSGTKTTDLTGNGFSADDTPLAGVTINLYRDVDGNGVLGAGDGDPIASTVTASNGTYSFSNVAAGTYFVQEVVPGNYIETGGPLYYSVSPISGSNIGNLNFANFQLASIIGTKFTDLTGNGISNDDTGLGGVTINLYLGSSASGTPATTTTASNGSYSFTNLAPGTYFVQETVPAGTTQTGGNAGYVVTVGPGGVGSGGTSAGNNFANFQNASITGTKFKDLTGNGISNDDTSLGGVAINLYQGSSATGTPIATQTTASDNGSYSFTNLAPGTYFVQETVPSGWTQTGGNAGYVVTIGPGGVGSGGTSAGNNFANFLNARIDIVKYVKPATTTPSTGGQGLTPGFWKQPHHFQYWVGYTQSQSYNAVFGLVAPNNEPSTLTLLGALQRGGGGSSALGRHAVAALLNAANDHVNFAFTQAEVIALVQSAYLAGNFEGPKNILAAENEKGGVDVSDLTGPLPTPSTPTPGYGMDANTAPGLVVSVGSQVTFTYVVTNTGTAPLMPTAPGAFVSDDNETPSIPGDDFQPTPVLDGAFNAGDDNTNGLLEPGEVWIYTYTKTVTAGQHTNVGSATGTPVDSTGNPIGSPVNDTDVANWFGGQPPSGGGGGGGSGSGLTEGQFATIGFWQNKNGQAVINSFNGGSTSTALGNWLATTFPNLFGVANVYTGNSLGGLTNAQVAAEYKSLWTPKGVTKNTYMQAFAVAFGIYADTKSLGGQSLIDNGLAAKFGFLVTTSGGGETLFGLGGNTAAFPGLPNPAPILQILQKVSSNFNPATGLFYGGNQSLTSAANNVLNGINTGGDIALTSSDSASTAADDRALTTKLQPMYAGTLIVAVDTPSGDQAAAMQARIADAIAALNGFIAAEGTIISAVPADQAVDPDARLHFSSTSAIGGMAQGVLGVAEAGGEVTVITGWNYYLGSSPAGIVAGQFDFQTVVMHELGHALDLGHSTDTGSVMFPFLSSGQHRRQLTGADLAIIHEAHGGLEALMAGDFAAIVHSHDVILAATPGVTPITAPSTPAASAVVDASAPVHIGVTATAGLAPSVALASRTAVSNLLGAQPALLPTAASIDQGLFSAAARDMAMSSMWSAWSAPATPYAALALNLYIAPPSSAPLATSSHMVSAGTLGDRTSPQAIDALCIPLLDRPALEADVLDLLWQEEAAAEETGVPLQGELGGEEIGEGAASAGQHGGGDTSGGE